MGRGAPVRSGLDEGMKVCQDCRYIERDDGAEIVGAGFCMHPAMATTIVNYVTGERSEHHPTCHLARTLHIEGSCGPEGALWEGLGE